MTQAQDPIAESVAAWKKVTDEYLAVLNRAFESAKASGATEAATVEAERAYLEVQGAIKTAAQKAYAPMVEAFGAVPLTEFQRLQDQVHTILLRLDHIDDALRAIREGVTGGATPPKKKKRKS